MNDSPLGNIGDLTKPATVLIEKVSEAVGGMFRPYQVVRVAKAEAEADRIRAEAQLQITDLQRRAMFRFLQEEAQKQANIESITQRALPLLKQEATPENVANDWIANFFDQSRIVSDEVMQELWARILASEANVPGTFSRRTVNLLADLDKRDAELFTCLCGFGWMIGDVAPLVFDVDLAIYNDQGITFDSLSHLESLGLIQFDNLAGFRRVHLPQHFRVFFCGRPVDLTFPNEADNSLDLGHVLLTRAGRELAPVCGAKPVEGFFEFVCDRWVTSSLVLARDPEQAAPSVG